VSAPEHIVTIFEEFGSFPADGSRGDVVRALQVEAIWDEMDKIVLDFEGVPSMTDSFANAFIGNIVETHPTEFRDKLRFRNCAPLTKSIIKNAIGYALKRVGGK
jgi:hypothetical protein